MRYMKIAPGKTNDSNSLNMGDILSLWDIAKNKIIGLSTLSIYYRQAKDMELKSIVKSGIENVITNHISKIQKLFNEKGYEYPEEKNWKKKVNEESPFIIPDFIINDEEIAMSLREIIRLTLSLEVESLRNATNEDIRNLVKEILDDDYKNYRILISLQKKKNWEDFLPVLLPESARV